MRRFALLFVLVLLVSDAPSAQELVVEYELDQHPSSLNPLPATLRNNGVAGLTATALQRKRDDDNFFLVQCDRTGNGDFLASFWPSGCGTFLGLEWAIEPQPGYEWRATRVQLSLFTSESGAFVGPQHYVLRLFNDVNGQTVSLLDVVHFGGGFPLNEEVPFSVDITDAHLAAIGLGTDPEPVALRFLFDGCEAGNASQCGGLSNSLEIPGNGSNLLVEGVVVEQVVLGVTPSDPTPAIGSRVPTCLSIDMASSGEALGSYGATLSWDPSILAFVNVAGGTPPFDTPVANLDDVGIGTLSLADADPNGLGNIAPIACVEFDVIGTVGTTSSLDAEVTSIFAAGTFTDLLPRAVASDAAVDVVLECTVGDVNQDMAVNSGDGLLILSDEIGLSIPVTAQESLAAGCGDANGDDLTDSIDANIVLSWEVGLSIDPSFPIGGSNQVSDDCTVCSTSERVAVGLRPRPSRADCGKSPLRWGWVVISDTRHEFTVELEIDLRKAHASLGSYSTEIAWNPSELKFLGLSPTPEFPSPLVNASRTSEGSLRLAQVDSTGAEGTVRLFRLRFRPTSRSRLQRQQLHAKFASLGSTAPGFENLLPCLPGKPTYSRRGR